MVCTKYQGKRWELYSLQEKRRSHFEVLNTGGCDSSAYTERLKDVQMKNQEIEQVYDSKIVSLRQGGCNIFTS